MNYQVQIMSMTGNPATDWCTLGSDRPDAEYWFTRALRSGVYVKPLYRVIVRPKPAA